MNRFQLNAQRVPAALRALLVTPCLALPLYWGVTYSGPYRWLAEAQLAHGGSYEVTLTGLGLVLLLLLPALAAVQLLGRRYAGRGEPRDVAAIAAKAAANEAWLLSHRGRLFGAGLGAVLTLMGLYFLADGALAGSLQAVDAAALEAGAAPTGRYVELTGAVRMAERVAVSESTNGSTIERYYLPVTSPGAPGAAGARVYLETYRSGLVAHADELRSGRVRGMLSENALPGVAQTELAARGVTLPARYWVLDYNRSPDDVIGMGRAFAVMGLVIGALSGAAWWLLERRER
jgi:hypothetical protein